jgi:hypothetical protein
LPITKAANDIALRRREPTQFDIATRWFAEHRTKSLCIAVAILSPLLSLYFVLGVVRSSKERMWIWHADDNGVLTYAPASIGDSQSVVFREIAQQAVEVMLKQDPKGLSNEAMIARYMTPEAATALRAHVKFFERERQRLNLFDQASFTAPPQLIDDSGGSLRFRLVGQIIRSGAIDRTQLVRNVGDFNVGIQLVPNTSIADRGRFPYVVADYRITVDWSLDKKRVTMRAGQKIEIEDLRAINTTGGEK